MAATTDSIRRSASSGAADQRRRAPVAALAGLAMAGFLVPLLMLVANLAVWETVDFVKNRGDIAAGATALGIGVAAMFRLALLHRRWWFLCVPAIGLWCLILLFAVWGRIDDGESGFGFHCATMRSGESIDAFADRMADWGHARPSFEPDRPGSGMAVFDRDTDTCFYVRFDERSRTIIEWRYVSV